LAGDYTGDTFTLSSDGTSGTDIQLTPALFTNGADDVDFNNLTPLQIAATNAGAELYNSLAGDDTIVLPDPGKYQLTPTVAWDPSQTFTMGDGNDTIAGGAGTDHISLGSGTDVVYGSPGNDTIQGGAGQDTFDYASSSGRFPDFADFSAGTTQTITGGHPIFETQSSAQNIVILPGSADDYTFEVTFTTDTLSGTNTSIQTIADSGFPISPSTRSMSKQPHLPTPLATMFC
jgi:hypothetical protein